MKTRFNTLDTVAIVQELKKIVGSRVNQVYDIDNKTYLIRLNKPDTGKEVLLFESGIRIHTTKCDWPKNPSPSGFTMKLRKHISNKRIIKLEQVGCDRIIDIQFGSGEVAFHIFIELFNRGNIVLTDYDLNIVSLLRSFNEGDSYRFAVHEKYPIDRARQKTIVTCSMIKDALTNGKKNETIKKVLLPIVDLGVSFLEHCLKKAELNPDTKLNAITVDALDDQIARLEKELNSAEEFLEELARNGAKGYILCKAVNSTTTGAEFLQMIDFHPYMFSQSSDLELKCFDTFTDAVDEYYSKIESQKIESDIIQKEKEVFKKVNKIRENQASRLAELSQKQLEDKTRADLIMNNADLVDRAISAIRTAIASQMSWGGIKQLIEEATRRNDPVASYITNTKFETNEICMTLHDPFADSDDENKPIEIDVDLSLSAHANAKRYYDHKKHAAIKEKKTLDSQSKALKSAEKKAQEILKTVKTQVSITKARKVYWFEKFFWFISSENYLVIGGRDQKQNELIVKRYMKAGDLYVHADLQGASSVIIKNPTGAPVPPKTLDEAGHMAVCYSNAWDSKILCRAWWVYHHQVSKTAPTGEYLVTGSFMIRGQKNYLLPTHLQLGFSFLFKVDESSAFRHVDERKTRILDSFQSSSEVIRNNEQEEIEIEVEEDNANSQNAESDDSNDNVGEDISHIEDNINDLKLNQNELVRTSESHEPVTLNLEDIREEESDNSTDDDNSKSETSPNLKIENSTVVDFNNKSSNQVKRRPNKKVVFEDKKQENKEESIKQGKLKRGQKSRLKKIKEKYKDQDEEEQKLRMSLLQSAGTPKKNKKNEKSSDKKGNKKDRNPPGIYEKPVQKEIQVQKENSTKLENVKNVENDDDIEAEKEVVTELDMLSLLTGQPHPEDEIIFAIPMVAPYSAVLSYKFKVKLIPGMGKRGKSARTALETFAQSKECTPREKDVMKSVNDQQLSQNFPGKVKIVYAQLKQPKKKK